MSKEFKKTGFAFGRENYRILIIGVVLVVLGYTLMVGGGTDDPNEFNEAEIFSFRRITLSPVVILMGLVTVLFGVMKKSKEND